MSTSLFGSLILDQQLSMLVQAAHKQVQREPEARPVVLKDPCGFLLPLK
jgi:hypothetical protein